MSCHCIPRNAPAEFLTLEDFNTKLMCISLYDVNSSDWTAKHSEVLSGQIVLLQNGGAYRDRTDDPLLAKQVLSQLS